MAAVAIGDVDTAQNVVVFTPGLNSTVDGALARHDNDMRLVRQECLMSAPRSTTATVTWIGYQAPQSTADSLTDPHKSVVTDAAAHTGGHQLAQFVSGLDAARETDAHITALGHSYGSTTTAAAALELSATGPPHRRPRPVRVAGHPDQRRRRLRPGRRGDVRDGG